jgi:gamma-glutamylcyclotransferase (GGCT)/AIG2-like uncharacterized protein YtfP
MLEYLFVYGTLRQDRNGRMHHYLKNRAVFIDKASLPGKLYLILDYPGAVPSPDDSGHTVQGEVYRLRHPTTVLQQLDEYEECSSQFPKPHEYQRLETTVMLASGKPVQAWVYWFRHSISGLKQISSGDYLE